ncbi:MAG: hypothetical protein A2287_04315 [Candidatus Melainabacteria bacterium RIFOXYA12_FULL_32_12]|nr:MAG: hypothetical protein A2255_03650 [Candidatus Melainabacteria bacterium RIFOXYA2_FULL_32_9]OGI27226.1 MAG: hypothetical protein A2287_04315 [Candidatus Melainabacteria bacterium RIFOXYA12_FULL_32_12]
MANFIPYKKFDGSANMAIDEALLADSIKNTLEPTLRLYGWSRPTLTLGRNQSMQGINLDFCMQNNIDIVKRPTGGRAVLHQHELTYSFIIPINLLKDGSSVLSSYKQISDALIISFKKLNVELSYPKYKKISVKDGYCMAISTGSDLNYQNKKLIGSAQFRKQDYILQHGSILIDIDTDLLSGIFGSNNLDSDLITLKSINSTLDDINLLSDALKCGFEEKFSLKFNDYSK